MTSPEPYAPPSTRAVAVIAALAVLMAILHLGTLAAQRQSMQAALAASDTFTAAEHLKARESLLIASANSAGLDRDVRADMLGEAMSLRKQGIGGQGIAALESHHLALRAEAQSSANRAGGLGLAEAGLGLAILMVALGEMLASVVLARLGLGLGAAGLLAGLTVIFGF